jgi:ATP-binding cassette subfamily B protein/subfamily B ATP-binding cassette protein MsbA
MMRLSYPRISKYPPGSLASFIEQASCAQDVVDLTSNTTRAALMFIVYVVLMLWVSVPMSVIGGIAMVLMWFALSRAIRKIKKLSTEATSAKIFLWRWTVELLSAPRLLRIFNSTDTAREMIKKAREAELIPERKATIIDAAIKPSLEFFAIFGAGVFLIVGYALAGDGASAAIPSLFVFVVVFYRLKPQLQALSDFRAKLAKLLPRLSILGKFLRVDDESYERTHGEEVRGLEQGIEFNDVGFRYPGTKNEVLTNISFSLPKGATMALVGPSGAGKSTITDLMAGLYQPTVGSIKVDGGDLAGLNIASWRKQLGVVEQSVLLLNASVRENICFGRETNSLETVKAAAIAAHADQFIENLELGYDTILGDKGFKLSGGQKQRIALARALYGNPEFLILDEATSALDTVSEKSIQQALAEMSKTRAILVVAHRLSTIADADEILVLEGGQIVERGNKEALLSKEGKFAHLWRMQT